MKAPARAAVDRLAELARAATLDLSAGLDAFRRRLELLEQAGVDLADAEFSAEFGRNLEYYTGFVFEIIAPRWAPRARSPAAAATTACWPRSARRAQVPAVGACIHTERLLAVLQGAAP